jgi:hypothetical protein
MPSPTEVERIESALSTMDVFSACEGNPDSFFAGFIHRKSFVDVMRNFLFASTLDRITGVWVEEVLKFARVAVGAIDGGYDAIAKAGIEGLLTAFLDLTFRY